MSERWTPAYDRMFDPDHHLAGDPACKRWAWLDLCHMAAWRDRTRILGATVVQLRRGELLASLRYLSDRWGWSVKKVRDFLEILEHPDIGKLETVKGTPKGTVYRVVSYGTYANPGHTQGHTGRAQRVTQGRAQGSARDDGVSGASGHAYGHSNGHDQGTGRAQVGHKEQQGVSGNNKSIKRGLAREDDELGQWLNGHSDVLPDGPPLDDPSVRRALYQHYGPPSMRASAWKTDDGGSVPSDERPRILALALSGYLGMEGKTRIVTSQFDGMLRAVARRELSQGTDGSDWLYSDLESA